MSKKYTLVSGFHREPNSQADEFFKLWLNNIQKLIPLPEQVIIICDSGARPEFPLLSDPSFSITVIPLTGNLGNCHMMLHGIKKHHYGGWSGVVLAGALLCYANETDLIFAEQDMLQFGNCIGKMYEEIGDGGIIFGSTDGQPCAQSLFLVKHFYIKEFVCLMLSQPRQDCPEQMGEHQFFHLEREHPDMWKRFSFGYDRTRPINYDDPIFYGQHWKPEELEELLRRGMI